MILPERRRRRPAVSCTLCRKRKIRCNRETPCGNCVRSRNEPCVYESLSSQPSTSGRGQGTGIRLASKPQRPDSAQSIASMDGSSITDGESGASAHQSAPAATESTITGVRLSRDSAQEVENLKKRLRQLEEQLAQTTPISTDSPSGRSQYEEAYSGLGGTFYINCDSRLLGEVQASSRSIMHKTRLFGQSHWINGSALFWGIFEDIEPHLRSQENEILPNMRKCKSLAKAIKLQRTPPWPSPLKSALPARDVADGLVDCYVRTTESIYRVLHIPTFTQKYKSIWLEGSRSDPGLIIQIKLVFAIGAVTYDDGFSLRSSAIEWIYEAQTWLSEPNIKSRLNLEFVQSNILLLIARELVGIGGSMEWISAGALLRTAVFMGLHRDPSHLPKSPFFVAEMRRRLWNTILEICVQSSLLSGGPPLISMDDFDTLPPGNFDEDQLTCVDAGENPSSHFTSVSMAISLRKTFPERLAVTKFLNDLKSQDSYQQTLRLDSDLRASYKAFYQDLQMYNTETGHSATSFQLRMADVLLHRYRLSLHIPYYSASPSGAAFGFSRKVVVDASFKIWYGTYPSSCAKIACSRTDTASEDQDGELTRLTTSGSGFLRAAAFLSSLNIAAELRAQLQEEENLGPILIRMDLLSIVTDAKYWSMKCMEVGETNFKGYLLHCSIMAQIEALRQGVGKDMIPILLVKAVENSVTESLAALQKMAGQDEDENAIELDEVPQITQANATDDWELMLSDSQIDFGDVDFMNWMFNGGVTKGLGF